MTGREQKGGQSVYIQYRMDFLTFPIRSDRLTMTAAVTDRVFKTKSAFQEIEIVETDVFGKALLLDGHIQLTEFDEAAYHESLVQIPLLSLSSPKSALVVGGGDGGVIRELCRCPDLEQIDMVEIDEEVVKASIQHLPGLSAGAFSDPRVHLHIADAFPFVKKAQNAYDLIVVDSTDTYEEEDGALSEALFTNEFYRDCLNALKPGDIVVTQADNPVFCPYSLEAVESAFKEVFPHGGSYTGLVPSFGGYSAFCWGGTLTGLASDWPAGRSESLGLKYLNQETYRLAFSSLKFS